MDRKIFISINIPDRIKKRLSKAILSWQDLPIRWIKEENYHVTLSFLGHINDALIADICEKIRVATEEIDIFDMEFEQIELGPTSMDARVVWLVGKPDEALRSLHEKIEKALGIFVTGKKTFRPHVTLGKIRKHKWEALPSKPEIKRDFHILLPAESVDVMASDFMGSASAYTLIASNPLK
jgi:2'-5' RNA ligase